MRLPMIALAALLLAGPAAAQFVVPNEGAVDTEGVVAVPAFRAPFSSFASPEARRSFIDTHQPGKGSAAAAGQDHGDVASLRAETDRRNAVRIAKAKAVWPVDVRPWTVDGVYTDIVTPQGGVAERNRHRVLINLHGGGFVFGARTGGLVEAIPIAGLGRITVVTVDYRMGPEHRFPAASEDVATVYRALLKQYRPENIGIYGCSAGGQLTGEALVWFQAHGLPRPGAAGVLCAGLGQTVEGDSRYTAPALNGQVPPAPPEGGRAPRIPMAYFQGADFADPLVTPLESPDMLARFPPTLFITSTRDIAMSPTITSHQTLVRLGVDADLHVWDGLQHAFFTDPDLPESREVFAVITRFFDRHLGAE
jgi:acetyl esterase/lipase